MADINYHLVLMNAKIKRDAYGFAVRPQHLQRYREYGHIYKEEEEERSEKWSNFLEQIAESTKPFSSAGEPCSPSAEIGVPSCESASGKNQGGQYSSGERSTAYSITEDPTEELTPVEKEGKASKIGIWSPISPSLAPVERLISSGIRKKANMNIDQEILSKHIVPCDGKRSSMRFSEENNCEELPDNQDTVANSNEDDCLKDSEKIKENSGKLGAKSEVSDSDMNVHEARAQPDADEKKEALYDTCQKNEALSDAKPIKGAQLSGDDVDPSENFPWKEELESLVQGGVPKTLRGEVWQAFVGVSSRRIERYYQDLLNSEMVSGDGLGQSAENSKRSVTPHPGNIEAETWRKQIEKDLPRTFPGHPALDEEGRNSLRRILRAYARHNPSVGYCQAMNFFAGILLLLMPEENAFWTLVFIIDDYFEGYYTHEMIESQVDQLVFEELMRERFPKLVNHLDYLGVQVAWISGPWFLSIFVNMLPWESVLRVWDVLLFEGNRVMLFRTALALMELYGKGNEDYALSGYDLYRHHFIEGNDLTLISLFVGPAIVTTKDAGDAITLLQSLAGSTFDSSQLVFTACMGFLAVNEARLEDLRNKHRPAVLGVVEERSRGSHVFKDSKGLASKLYSFKYDSQSFVKEAKTKEGLGSQRSDKNKSHPKYAPEKLEELFSSINIDPELESLPDLQDQVVWLKIELCRMLEEKRLATIRAEELETAFIEMVKEDNRLELSAKVEQLELEVAQLRQALADKQEQEHALVKVLMGVEQEQKLAEDARLEAEKDAAAQRHAVRVLQEKYDKAMASLAEAEKRTVMAESMLEATLQYQSGQTKAVASPGIQQHDSSKSPVGRKTGLFSFGLGWRDRNKEIPANAEASGRNGSVLQGIHSNTDDPREHVDDLAGLKTEKKEGESHNES
ncbi:TBC1 domain family member 9-like protein [Drosera capensis]